ncbi:hypothetical protein FQA39_LY17040 [Lamprigera yunnana]|nr:hypothetical protein FQA39_LY17040 [Lamprigera yunnana]
MGKRKAVKNNNPAKKAKVEEVKKKYSLDSDEEDYVDDGNILNDDEIEGEEEGRPSTNIGREEFTSFNMREEMEEGHFDRDGHFIWKNEKEVRDNWLDNIDWEEIKPDVKRPIGLGDDSDDSDFETFSELQVYKQIITYLKPRENINKALLRWGGNDARTFKINYSNKILGKTKKLSSLERLRQKKAGILNPNVEVTKLTELADKILSETGNMDIYQETYESICLKIKNYDNKLKMKDATLDMYADDFDSREKETLESASIVTKEEKSVPLNSELMWEFKWDQKEDKLEGPFNTMQMLKWVKDGYFKKGAWVRKQGENTNFYSINRVDFELFI